MARRVKPNKPQPSSAFSAKDDEAEKIRIFRENMRRKSKTKPSNDEEFTFRRENIFDFEAWYKAHFHDDFETKIRDERKQMYDRQYREQMERIARGLYRIRPPRPLAQHKRESDIDSQTIEMEEKELREQITNVLKLASIILVGLLIAVYILQKYLDRNIEPYQDPYAKQILVDSSKKT